MNISLIAAADSRLGIGKDGKIPWDIPGDMRRFHELTMHKPIIMGRKTYESIGGPLKSRINVVLTRDPEYSPGHRSVMVCDGLYAALARLRKYPDVCIIGGEKVYETGLRFAHEIFLTRVIGDFGCDRHFPEIPGDEFRLNAIDEYSTHSFQHFYKRDRHG